MMGKLYSREGQLDKALEECRKGEGLMNGSKRNDALFLLEKAKLFRNIASTHVKLAVQGYELRLAIAMVTMGGGRSI